MTFIVGLIILGFFFLAIHHFTEFDNAKKIGIAITILSIMAIAIMFNEYSNEKNRLVLDVTLKFQQGKTIKCDGKDVNSTNYTLSVGTYTFIGRKNTPNFEEMISASKCK